jgi:hypothetical protein
MGETPEARQHRGAYTVLDVVVEELYSVKINNLFGSFGNKFISVIIISTLVPWPWRNNC